ncbi:MAG: cytochrome c-type biogenesis protein [Thiomicrorhabdus sp.]|nr:MAG: cytochrome c-type biogenesis protein [Thiomicrorhabdus sp.]
MDEFSIFLQGYLDSGLLIVLPLVIFGGLLTAFNPCCIPMYPAVFGFMGKVCCCPTTQCEQVDNKSENIPTPFVIAMLFVLGMAVTTTLMGILTISAGWVFGQFDVRLKFLLAIIPILMGLYVLGWRPVKYPSFFSNKRYVNFSQKKQNAGTAFGAGFLFTLIIAPCATPILIVILSFIALKGDLFYGSLLMFIYGLASGLPILLIALGFKKVQQFTMNQRLNLYLRRFSGLLLLGVGMYVILNIPW